MIYWNTSGSCISCGIHQLFGFEGEWEDDSMNKLAGIVYRGYSRPAFIIFSNRNIPENNSFKLASEIERLKLGRVCRTRPVVNCNSGNEICLWWWEVNHGALSRLNTKTAEEIIQDYEEEEEEE